MGGSGMATEYWAVAIPPLGYSWHLQRVVGGRRAAVDLEREKRPESHIDYETHRLQRQGPTSHQVGRTQPTEGPYANVVRPVPPPRPKKRGDREGPDPAISMELP